MPIRIPTNSYADDLQDRDISLGLYEELRSLRRTLQYLAVLLTPVAVAGLIRILNS